MLVAGTLLNAKTVRIEPALNIPRSVVDQVLEALDETLQDVSAAGDGRSESLEANAGSHSIAGSRLGSVSI